MGELGEEEVIEGFSPVIGIMRFSTFINRNFFGDDLMFQSRNRDYEVFDN